MVNDDFLNEFADMIDWIIWCLFYNYVIIKTFFAVIYNLFII